VVEENSCRVAPKPHRRERGEERVAASVQEEWYPTPLTLLLFI
jgi:hypothetical protein